MANRKQPPRRLFKGQERASSYAHDRSPTGRMKRVAREHEDVLQNIEFILVDGHRRNPAVDDRAALGALQAALTGAEADDELAAVLASRLVAIRQARPDVGDEVWRDAVRVVADSIRRHSALQAGETAYLDFVAPYVK